MKSKAEIIKRLTDHALKLDPQHYELASVAMAETEVQIDIRDILARIAEALEEFINLWRP